MASQIDIRRAQVRGTDAADVVQQFHQALAQPDAALVIFFCSCHFNLEVIAREMARLFGPTQVIGCTTAGEIGPAGYCQQTLAGVSFPADHFAAVSGRLDNLRQFNLATGQRFAQQLHQQLHDQAPEAMDSNTFAFQMIDGLSVREEPVTRVLQASLGRIPLVGGSAGDNFQYACTQVYHDGRFHTDSAVITLMTTDLPFRPFMAQHFVAQEQRVVVTAADVSRRIVYELDGRPAAEVYGELIGVPVADLTTKHFASAPLVVMVGSTHYVRSISKALADGSLEFFCAIDEGMVLRIARSADLLDNLQQTFQTLRDAIGPPELTIACDCVLRKLEIEQHGLTRQVTELLEQNHGIGLNTFGEQYRGLHINQTITGIAIGAPSGTRHP